MRTATTRVGLFVAALAACHTTPAPTVAIVLPRAAVVSPPPRGPEPVAAACATVLDEQQTVLREAIVRDRAESPGEFKDVHDDAVLARAALGNSGVACYAFPGGIWSLELQNAHVAPDPPHAYGDLVAVARIGATRAAAPDTIQTGYGDVSSRLAADFDGDGVPELYVDLHIMGPEGGESDDAKIWTVDARGAVVRYAPSSAIEITGAPFDADGDGRPDLPTSDGLSLMGEASCDYSKDYGGRAQLLAHSLKDGSFSLDDDVAKAWARKSCPRAPGVIASRENALCARLWAKTRADVTAARARVVSSCVQWDCDRERKNQPQLPKASQDCNARKDTFDQNVPFTLP